MADRKKKPAQKRAPAKNAGSPARVGAASPVNPAGTGKGTAGSFVAQFIPYVLIVFAILLAVCLFTGAGTIGGAFRKFFLGLNGFTAFFLPAFFILHAVTLSSDLRHGLLPIRIVSSAVTYAFVSVFVHVVTDAQNVLTASVHYVEGGELKGGGVVGGLLGSLMLSGFGKPGTLVIVIAVLIVSILLMFGFTPKAFAKKLAESAKKRAEKRAIERERENEIEEQIEIPIEPLNRREIRRSERAERTGRARAGQSEPIRFRYRRKRPFIPDIPLDDDYPAEPGDGKPKDEEIFEEAMERTKKRRLASGDEYETPAAMSVDGVRGNTRKTKEKTAETADGEKNRKSKKISAADGHPDSGYVFPPISLLPEDVALKDTGFRDELHENGVKLVETLKSFNVRTRIEDISRGPTITRYELLPEPGTRVRSIVNLVDDISLNLATTGVRIEAPVPGKAVVGIEVPNKNKAIVHLRTLLDDKKFSDNTSKLFCALGEDVAGESVYLDIGKMPHLLIAGATGMGKSVCINSLIVSLLYKSTPDEVKLILIDPKKVELNIYNGIPHLLVPVVTDPKKAAGSLSWAVSEMERRFGLIEAVGVRDVTAFNKITANDPEYEYLPYIVIIIDELADLMMTAPDNVEDSICRLMQKARAAGMHVIIGTQRPSVDVITGLIKANIPSRIAFTVASQVDSRTILDRAGAENLIGKGDMLYLPVSASKPIRVQGAFVHETDVENIVTYIKDKNKEDTAYSKDVIDKIEEAAKNVGKGKKGGGGSFEGESPESDDDPMLRDALELAVTTGKISTSLIQRKLSLGYGRAAKLIDRMQELGFVSEPSGQKPREVLITREQFMEMVMRDSGEDTGDGSDEEYEEHREEYDERGDFDDTEELPDEEYPEGNDEI